MNQPYKPDAPAPGGDPWAAFGYLVAGVAFYGAAGWGLSIWLHADYWIPVGILVGLGLGMFMVFSRYRIGGSESPITDDAQSTTDRPAPGPLAGEAAHEVRPDTDDRGETA